MNKKLIALAIATAFAAPVAMADSGNVKIDGEINMSFDSTNGTVGAPVTSNASNQTMSNVSSNASMVRFSGDEDLGNGMKAIWSVQTFTSLGGNGNSDSASTANDAFGNGNSFLGLTGGFGTVRLGKFDTVFKTVGRKVDLFTNSVGDARNLTATGGGNATAGTTAGAVGTVGAGNAWDLRVANAVDYTTPALNGFQGVVAYATNAGTAGGPTTANTLTSTSVISVGGTYENGPVFAGLAYERHNLGGSTLVTAPTAWRLSGGYNFGDLKLVGMYQNTKDNNGTEGIATANTVASNANTASDDDRNVWGLGAAYKMGSNTLKAQYYRAGDFGGLSDTGANMVALGVDHTMSKRTTAYVAYARTANDTRSVGGASASLSVFSATGGGHGDNAGSIAGQNTNSVSVGMIHKF